MEVLGWVIDTRALSISVPQMKLTSPGSRRAVPHGQAPPHLRGSPPWKIPCAADARSVGVTVSRGTRRSRFVAQKWCLHGLNWIVSLGPEFRSDVWICHIMVEGAFGADKKGWSRCRCSVCLQPHCRTLWSDASGDAMGGYCCLETGKYMDLPIDVRQMLRTRVLGKDDLSINLLAFLGSHSMGIYGRHRRHARVPRQKECSNERREHEHRALVQSVQKAHRAEVGSADAIGNVLRDAAWLVFQGTPCKRHFEHPHRRPK